MGSSEGFLLNGRRRYRSRRHSVPEVNTRNFLRVERLRCSNIPEDFILNVAGSITVCSSFVLQ